MSNKIHYICKAEQYLHNMKPSEAKKTIEKQIADLELERFKLIREIWDIEAKIERKKETLSKFTNYGQGNDN